METFKKILWFFALFLAIVGCIGTIGWLIYSKAWVILIGALIVDAFAAPTWWEKVKWLIKG